MNHKTIINVELQDFEVMSSKFILDIQNLFSVSHTSEIKILVET